MEPMPFHKQTCDKLHVTLRRTQGHHELSRMMTSDFMSNVNCQLSNVRKSAGFTLVEILISLFLILTLLSILFTVSGSYVSSRKSGLEVIAAKIASKQVEVLRKTAFASLPSSGSFSDPDLSKLPQSSATQTIADYQSDSTIKQITIQINWVFNGANKQFTMDTLRYQNGY